MRYRARVCCAGLILAGALTATPAAATTAPGAAPHLTDPGLRVEITEFRPVLERVGRGWFWFGFRLRFHLGVAVRNHSGVTVDEPLRVAALLNREVLNADGVNGDGLPFVDICRADCRLEPGARSASARFVLGRIQSRGRGFVFPRLAAEYEADRVHLLHFADADGTGGALQNVVPFSAILDELRAQLPGETLVLSSGDNFIPGPRFAACEDPSLGALIGIAGPGRCDIAFVNAFGTRASAVGNHELDLGPETFADQIAQDVGSDGSVYVGAQFPYLGTNLDFSLDMALAGLVVNDGEPAETVPNRLAGSTTVEVDGETIGIVGATTPILDRITSTGDIGIRPVDATDIAALAAEIQPTVDRLVSYGIDKIILLGHMQQIAVEKELATRLTDVDIIVAGGSNTLLADGNDTLRVGDTAADDYPLLFQSPAGAPVAVVNTDGDYKYLGRLLSAFDLHGELVTALLDPAVNGAYATDDAGLANVGDPAPLAEVELLSQALTDVLAVRDGNIFGSSSVYLDGRRGQVRTEETNLGNLTADANLALARTVDPSVRVSLKNGGGIRADIGRIEFPPGSTDPDDALFLPTAPNPAAGKEEGDISQFDIQQTLRFNNGLTLLTLTAQELADVVEHGVSATAPGVTPGQFPQVAGMAFSFDPTKAPGDRVQSLAVLNDDGSIADVVVEDGLLQGAATRTFRIVTLSFLADGGDSYPFPPLVNDCSDGNARCDLVGSGLVGAGTTSFADDGSEQDALAEYIEADFATTPFDVAETPIADDERIQNLSERTDDTVLPMMMP